MPLNNRILNKLWEVAKLLGNKEAGNPFDPDLLKLNEAQLDFILEKYVEDDPKRGKFIRPSRETMTGPQQHAKWEHVLIGKAREEFMSRFKLNPAVAQKAAALRNAASQLKQRFGSSPTKKMN